MWVCPNCREKQEDGIEACLNCGTSKDGAADPASKPADEATDSGLCVKCGSECVVPKATVWDQGQASNGKLQAYVYSKPGAMLFKGAVYATLYARICGQCGHVELFADGAEKLYETYRASQEPENSA